MKKMEKPTTTNKDVKGMTNAYNRLKNYKPTSEEVEHIEEGGMPSSVIKHKQSLATKSPEELHAGFKEVANRIGKSVEDTARSTAWSHGYGKGEGKGSGHYWNKIKHLEEGVEQIDEAFPTVADGEKNLRAKEGKTSKGTLIKTKTGVKHERDYDDQPEPEEKRGRGRPKKRLGEMRQEYMQYISEEPDNETFTKELEDQKAKFAGKKKGGDVAKPSVQAVKQEQVEQMDEADIYSIKNKKTGQIYHHSKYPITKNTQKFKQIKSAGGDHVHAEIHVNGKPIKEDVEQMDEVAPPGREDQVKALKKVPGIDNPYAVSWASYRKSHPKKSKE
jgi:hypothetical protein